MGDAIFFTFIALCVLVMARTRIVDNRHIRRIHEIHAENLAAIDAGTDTLAMFDRYSHVGDFYLDMLDLRKWSYAQFYPEPTNDL